MTLDVSRPLTLHDVITYGAGGPGHLDDYLTSEARQPAALQNVPPSTQRSINGELRTALDGTLRHDIIAVLGAGWQASAALREAAHRTATTPGASEFVELITQTITQDISPSAHLYLDGRLLITVELQIAVEVTFHNLCAVVRSGALTAIDFGKCDATVSIRTSAGTPLLKRTLTITSNTQLPLSHPISLLSPAPR